MVEAKAATANDSSAQLLVGKKRKRRVTNDLLDLSALFRSAIQNKRTKSAATEETEISCPYLGQIRKHMLDFDFHKQCSVSLSTLNVYCCLVCGKYFQGKGPGTAAY